jgi:hypothetical protein
LLFWRHWNVFSIYDTFPTRPAATCRKKSSVLDCLPSSIRSAICGVVPDIYTFTEVARTKQDFSFADHLPSRGLHREVIYDLAYYAYGHGGIDTVLILETRNPTPLRISYYSTDSACTDTVAKASSLDAVVDTFVY